MLQIIYTKALRVKRLNNHMLPIRSVNRLTQKIVV